MMPLRAVAGITRHKLFTMPSIRSMKHDPFIIDQAQGQRLPIVLSVPHAGTEFPEEVRGAFRPGFVHFPVDTDWFVHQLYEFAPALGITMIRARNSRYVIDLNRDPAGQALYDDGRMLTELLPTRSFQGEALYREQEPDEAEIAQRLEAYYWPYYQKIKALLDELRGEFDHVLLWDCHSIRQRVPTIRPDAFPDMILGDQDGRTAHPDLTAVALQHLAGDPTLQLEHNDPFKGGHITRYFGNPAGGIHALQLELTQVNYMDEERCSFDPQRAGRVRPLLEATLKALAKTLGQLQ